MDTHTHAPTCWLNLQSLHFTSEPPPTPALSDCPSQFYPETQQESGVCPAPLSLNSTLPPPSSANTNTGLSSKRLAHRPPSFFRAQVPVRALPTLGSCGGLMGDPEKWTVLAESAAYLLSAVFLFSQLQAFCGDATVNTCLTPALPLTSDSDLSLLL